MPVIDEFCTAEGILHSGAVLSLIDIVTSFHIYCVDGFLMNHVTISLSANFYKPAMAGNELFILSKVRHRKGKLIHLDCSVFNSSGVMLFEGHHSKTFIKLPPHQLRI